MVTHSSNINKPKESLNSVGRQFLQYQQTKRKFEQWWSKILPISANQKKVLTVMANNSSNINKPKESLNSDVNNSSNINKPKESFSSDGQQFLQYQQTKRKFSEWWSTIPPKSSNQKKLLTVMVNNSTKNQQNKRKFWQWR